MRNTSNFLQKVEKTTKEVDEVISAVTMTTVCIIVTVKMIRDTFFRKSD